MGRLPFLPTLAETPLSTLGKGRGEQQKPPGPSLPATFSKWLVSD